MGPRSTRSSHFRLFRDIAWKAQLRLHGRYKKLIARGKRSNVAITAVARELVGFIWDIARRADPAAA